ncbi:DUF6612 family protein, partial [Siminovitchia fortis]|uniref:DUF6612 family protein n=1 Tax=Siminovitchia fortis TaxID=254758 RepID=UPI0036F30E78
MNINHTLHPPPQNHQINSHIHIQFLTQPIPLHQKITISIQAQNHQIHPYFTKQPFYIYHPNQKISIKLPQQFSAQ